MSGIGVQDVKFPKKSIKVMLKIHAMAYGLAKGGIKYQYMGEKTPKGNEHRESRDGGGLWR